MEIVHNKIELPSVLVREIQSINGCISLTKLFLVGEISGGIRHPLIIDLGDEKIVEALTKACKDDSTVFDNKPFGLLLKKEELAKLPCPLFEHDLLLWFV
ncbi:hypothetical protein FACS1894190_18370 [Spirochaetia bacterium]|nr:hypothetical protein FACS1894190_18370 [Spirochaetia bacterium]